MTLITCKQGVTFAGFSPALVRILAVLMDLSDRYCVMVTSASDGKHMTGSRHYSMEAVDVKTKHFTASQKQSFLNDARAALGGRFTVLLEDAGLPNEHAHFQPVKGTAYTLAQLRQV